MSFVLAQFLTGLANASALFLVAAGLSLIFGVTRIINFAHGSLYMLGAYLAFTLTSLMGDVAFGAGYWVAVVLSALIVAGVGVLIELVVLRPVYRAPVLYPLLATFGVVLILQDVALALWGPEDRLGEAPPGLDGVVDLPLDVLLPSHDLFLIAVAPVMLAALLLLLRGTRLGILIRAGAQDREMLSALGVDPRRLFTIVFALGSGLAGLGGALVLPREAAHVGMDLSIIVEAFVVVVIGGMGSLWGAFLAAILIAQVQAFGLALAPSLSLVFLFVLMAVVLSLRPQGLLGLPEIESRGDAATAQLQPPGGWGWRWILGLSGVMALAPFVLGDYALGVAAEVLAFALLGASLQLVTGVAGMISFGHAAYFALGAYGAALAVEHLGASMGWAIAVAPLAGLAGASVVGWFATRLSGVYFAMLTLAAAQIVWTIAHQWTAVTGGDNGILGLWPPAFLDSPARLYWLVLAIVAGAAIVLRLLIVAPVGYALRAARDAGDRAEALGLAPRAHRWAAFALAGGFAGLAGGLYAFIKGSVFPTTASLSTSIDALVVMLLGGLHAPLGPALGALTYVAVKAELLTATSYWRILVGILIVVICILAPDGLTGVAHRLRARLGAAGLTGARLTGVGQRARAGLKATPRLPK